MAENRMVVVYTLLASAVATLALAAVFWSRVIDLGDQSETMAALLVVIAIMDLVFVAIFLRRITR